MKSEVGRKEIVGGILVLLSLVLLIGGAWYAVDESSSPITRHIGGTVSYAAALFNGLWRLLHGRERGRAV